MADFFFLFFSLRSCSARLTPLPAPPLPPCRLLPCLSPRGRHCRPAGSRGPRCPKAGLQRPSRPTVVTNPSKRFGLQGSPRGAGGPDASPFPADHHEVHQTFCFGLRPQKPAALPASPAGCTSVRCPWAQIRPRRSYLLTAFRPFFLWWFIHH